MAAKPQKISIGKSLSREITFAQAINEALVEEMRRDSTIFVIGEDVAEAGTPFKVLSCLVKEFGKHRVIDSPISEAGISGIAVGAAMTGMRPIVDIMFGDFVTLTMDQMVNQAAKIHYMSGGKLKVPMVVRIVGTNAEEAAEILREANLITADSLDDAAARAVAAARGVGS
jgi:acetoin:2,6-dichlorophenolindophenol oxidoreductase subunit beta